MILRRILRRDIKKYIMKDIVSLFSLLYNVKFCEVLRIFKLIGLICIALRK
jgi:hypothetical protein